MPGLAVNPETTASWPGHGRADVQAAGRSFLGERAGDFFKRQAVFAYLDEVVQQLRLLTSQAVLEHDQQAVQPPG